jgi:two-component system CheB/CheR fusion protein
MKKTAPKTKPAKPAATSKSTRPPAARFPVVGIGASAGGLEAVTSLLKHLPEDTGMAFVVVQHLDPAHESALSSLLSRATEMTVSEARDGVVVAPGHVYIIPPNKKMGIDQGTLRLLPREAGADLHAPVDYFFRALASDQGAEAVGIVLSGTGTDGTQGMEEIKAAGGITFAQNEASARYAGMPASATASGSADYVLPPEEIADELVRIGRHPHLRRTLALESESELQIDGDEFKQICALLRTHSGVDFSHYKPATLRRRITRRMVVQKLDTLKEYVACLRGNSVEIETLFQDILICVTGFFRDANMFDLLKKKVFPKLIKNRQPDAPIRLWTAGCSTGEEAYSMAIALVEFMEKAGVRCPVQLFGTDINDSVINRARAGIYPERIKDDISPERLRKFFTKSDGGYRINKSIRDLCMFARQNVFEDPPFSHVDLISCRNVLIYFDAALQKKVMPVFHYALRPHGFLVLGTAESVGGHAEMFALIDAKYRIYEKKFAHTRHTGLPARFSAMQERHDGKPSGPLRTPMEPVLSDIRKQADAMVLSQFSPAGVVVNSSMEILQFRGRTGAFLENTPGEATLNLLKMARQGLAVELRPLIAKATKQKRATEKDGVQVRHDGRMITVNVRVQPLQMPNFTELFFLILFEERSSTEFKDTRKSPTQHATATQRELEHLRDELTSTKLSLQHIIEEQDASNEELRAANEEILSSNEELQSTNEEMETATEELQSTNEELITLNDELQNRNVELQELSDDMVNLFSSVDVPIIILSADLRIRRFTPRAVKVLNLLASDVGRPISDFKIKLHLPNLTDLISEVLDTLSVKELDVQDFDDRWYSLRIRPYKTADNRINGVVLTLQDIDVVKRALGAAESARTFSEAIVATVREPLLVLDGELHVKLANRSFYNVFRTKPERTEGKFLYDICDGAWALPKLRELLEKVLPEKSVFHDFRIEQNFPAIGRRTMLLNARSLASDATQPPSILLAKKSAMQIRVAKDATQIKDLLAERSQNLNDTERTTALMEQMRGQQEQLEIQNSQLREAHTDLEYSRHRYADLYNLAPVGFMTLNAKGCIQEINHTACELLGHLMSHLQGKPIVPYFAQPDRKTFLKHLWECQHKHTEQSVTLRLLNKHAGERLVEFTTRPAQDFESKRGWCRSAIIDVTEKRRISTALSESEAKFRQLADNVGEVFWFMELEPPRITYVSPAFEQIWGLPVANLYTDHLCWERAIHPDDLPAVNAAYNAWISGQTDKYRVEYRVIQPGGNTRWISDRGIIIGRRAGCPHEISGIARDITERKQSEQRFRGLLESAPDAMIIVNQHGLIDQVNAQTVNLFGYAHDELVGQPMEMLMPERFRRRHVSHRTDYAVNAHARPMGKGLELFARHKDGGEFPVEISLSPLETAEGPIVISTVRDITDRRSAEHEILHARNFAESTLEAVPASLAVLDSQGVIIGTNQAWHEFAHLNGATDEAIGKGANYLTVCDVAAAAGDSGAAAFAKGMREVMSGKTKRFSMEYPCHSPDEQRWFVGYVTAFQGNGPHSVVIAHVDISERKRAEETILRMNERLEDRVARRTAALRIANEDLREEITKRRQLEQEISHISDMERQRIGQDLHDDLGQQIAGISLLSGVLKKNLVDQGSSEVALADELIALLKDALALTRSLARGLQPVALDVGGFGAALEELSQRTSAMFRIQCHSRCPAKLHLENTVATHLYRIAQEAVTNAVKHGAASKIEITLTNSRDQTILCVHDNGSGLCAKLNAPTQGMGLRIMRYRSDLIGGTLEFQHPTEGGTNVVCTLPFSNHQH